MEGSATDIIIPQTVPPQNPWKIKPTVEPCSFAEVMSEELAMSLRDKENSDYLKTMESPIIEPFSLSSNPDCGSDYALAQTLQMEFDREHDDMLKREEDKFNGKSKVSISFANYRKAPDGYWDSDSSDECLEEPKNWDSFEEGEKNSPTVGKIGFTRHGSTITTKHDATICGRKNACRVMGFPPGFETGDAGGFDMKLPNNVYNHLKVHSMTEEKRNKRLHDKIEKSTAVQAFDPKTRLLLFKIINNGSLESIGGTVSSGKEAVILHGIGGKIEGKEVPPECALKVFKTTLNEFKNRDRYIKDDHRFRERYSKQNPRKIIRLWAEKEMRNLIRMNKCGISCPEVVLLKKHILVMSFIGINGTPAPKLKDAILSKDQLDQAYQQCLETMKKMYTECNLVHADLSEYNMLWHNNQIWFIDVSQSVEPIHPQALEFLFRDCSNVSSFFSKSGVPNVPSGEELFSSISGVKLPGKGEELLNQIQNYERDEEILTRGTSENNYNFDYMFNLAVKSSAEEKLKPDIKKGIV